MADEKKTEAATKAPEKAGAAAGQAAPGSQRIRINFEGAKRDYANFCTLMAREGEIILNFGKQFGPATELKVDSQVIMNLQSAQQLQKALGQLMEQLSKAEGAKKKA